MRMDEKKRGNGSFSRLNNFQVARIKPVGFCSRKLLALITIAWILSYILDTFHRIHLVRVHHVIDVLKTLYFIKKS